MNTEYKLPIDSRIAYIVRSFMKMKQDITK